MTLNDPQVLTEARKTAKLEIDPIDGPGIEKMVNGLYEIEPAVQSSETNTGGQVGRDSEWFLCFGDVGKYAALAFRSFARRYKISR